MEQSRFWFRIAKWFQNNLCQNTNLVQKQVLVDVVPAAGYCVPPPIKFWLRWFTATTLIYFKSLFKWARSHWKNIGRRVLATPVVLIYSRGLTLKMLGCLGSVQGGCKDFLFFKTHLHLRSYQWFNIDTVSGGKSWSYPYLAALGIGVVALRSGKTSPQRL